MWSFFWFPVWFASSWSTTNPVAVVSHKIARAGATQAPVLNISKAFDRVWQAGLPHKLKRYRISGQIFGLISSFLSKRSLCMVLDGKSSQEYPVNAEVLQGFILGPTLILQYINDLPNGVISNMSI